MTAGSWDMARVAWAWELTEKQKQAVFFSLYSRNICWYFRNLCDTRLELWPSVEQKQREERCSSKMKISMSCLQKYKKKLLEKEWKLFKRCVYFNFHYCDPWKQLKEKKIFSLVYFNNLFSHPREQDQLQPPINILPSVSVETVECEVHEI